LRWEKERTKNENSEMDVCESDACVRRKVHVPCDVVMKKKSVIVLVVDVVVRVSSNEAIAACSNCNSRNVDGNEMMDGVSSSGSRTW